MRLAYLAVMLGCSSLGCSHLGKSERHHCHAEDEGEEITVHAKPQKVIVESVTAAPQSVPAATPQSNMAPSAPMANQPMMAQPMMAQPMMAQPMMMPMNMMQSQPTNVRVRERTGLGITMDKIDISIPFPRLIAVQKPTEVTYQMPHAPMMGAPMMGQPMSMPMMGMPMMQPGMPMMQPGIPMMAQMPHPAMPMAPTTMAAPPANGLTQQQILQLAQAIQQQQQQQQQSAPSAQQQSASSNLMDDKELDELQKKCDQLKKLREQRDALRKQAGGN